MRKILIIFIWMLVSCESSLDLEPKMYISAEEAFSNAENFEAALTGCYDALQLQHYYGRNLVIVGDMLSDNSRASGTKVEYYSTDENSLLSDNILVEGIWQDIYSAMNRVNYVLYKLDHVDFLENDLRDDLEGQLRFLRALHYFNLVRLYGDVPMPVEPTLGTGEDYYYPRSAAGAVYEQITGDLEIAVAKIRNTRTDRATVNSARALLSLVYLTMKEYQDAMELAADVLETNNYLEEELSDLYALSSEPSPEILMYVAFNPTDKNRLAEYHMPYQLGGRYEHSPSDQLVGLIDPMDQRADWIASQFSGNFYTRKYSDLNTGSDPVILFRTADLLFIEAEAMYYLDSLLYQDEILGNINSIRERAGLNPYTEVPAGGLFWAIDRERQVEFAFEGKRWFDLLRNGRAIDAVPTVISSDQLLFPIPLSEILANPFISIKDQNPGY